MESKSYNSDSESSTEEVKITFNPGPRPPIKRLYPYSNETNVSDCEHNDSANKSPTTTSRRPRSRHNASQMNEQTPGPSPGFRSRAGRRFSDSRSRSPIQPQRHKTPAPPEIVTTNQNVYWIIGIIIVSILAFLFVGGTSDQPKPSERISCAEFMKLKDTFPEQDRKLFKSIMSGVESTINKPPEPSVFSIFSTDEKLIDDVMKEVLSATKRCLNTSEKHIILRSDQLNDKLITDYKQALEKKKVMLITNVDEASPESAKSLHSFTDTFNPVVVDSIIFLTMHVPSQPPGKPVEYINNYLQNRWKNLAENIRSPLITRILDQTFFLKP